MKYYKSYLFVAVMFLFLLFIVGKGATKMKEDTNECRAKGGIQMETGNGRVCVKRDILLVVP